MLRSSRMLLGAAVAACGLLPACEVLPDIDFGQCGNGLVEPDNNEDCDVDEDETLGSNLECGAPDDPIRRCRYLCGSSAGAPSCPEGWHCGVDNICLFASGEYTEVPSEPLSAPATALEIADFDGDGRDDLLALTSGGLSYRFSSAAGSTDASLDLPFPFGDDVQPAVLDLDGDGFADALVPFGSGMVVLRGEPGRIVQAVQYPTFSHLPDTLTLHPTPVPADLVGLPGEVAVSFAADVTADGQGLCVIHPDKLGTYAGGCGDHPQPFAVPAGLDPTQRTIRGVYPGRALFLVHGHDALHVLAACVGECPDGAIVLQQTVALPGPAAAGLHVTDVDGDGAADLLVEGVDGAYVAQGGPDGWADAVAAPFLDGAGWPLDSADLDGDGVADYLFDSGAYLHADDGLTQVYVAVEPWREARFGDFNGDGAMDAAGTAADPRIEILMNAGGGVFNPGQTTTQAVARELTVADVDGDLVDDLAFAQDEFLNDPDEGTSVAVIYGTGLGLPTAPIEMGRVDYVLSIERFPGAFFGFNNDRIDELLVGHSAAPDGSGLRSYTQLSTGGGIDPVRRLGSVLSPPPYALWSSPRAVLALEAVGAEGAPAAPTDLLLIRQDDVWLLRGSGGLAFEHPDMTPIDLGELCGTEAIDPSFLVARPVRLADAARDSAWIYDTEKKPRQPDDVVTGRVMLLTEHEGSYVCQTTVADVTGTTFTVADLNRNDLPESLLVSKPGSSGPRGIAWDVPAFDPDGPIAGIDNFSPLLFESELSMTGMVGIDVDADRELELLVLTSADLRLGDISLEGGFEQRRDEDDQPETVLERPFSAEARLVVGDVNGDGLQDVIISDDAQLTTLLGEAGKAE